MRLDTRKISGAKADICRYDGISDVLTTPVPEVNKEHAEEALTSRRGADWYGINRNGNSCIKLFTDGWLEGVTKLSTKSKKFELEAPLSPAPIMRPRQCYSDVGETVDVQALLSGDLDHMWHGMTRRKMEELKTRVHIIVDVGGHAGESADILQWAGILAAVLSARGIENGFDVKITAIMPAKRPFTSNRLDAINIVTLKHYDAPMSMANLAPLMLPAFFRAVGFKAFFNSKHCVGYSIGSRYEINEKIARELMAADFDDGTPLFIHGVRSNSQAVKAYKELIKTINRS